MASTSCYTYYRVRPDGLEPLRGLIRVLFERIEQRFGVRGRVLARCDQPTTWMEIYEPVADPTRLQAALDEECQRLGFAAYLAPGEVRHDECFVEA